MTDKKIYFLRNEYLQILKAIPEEEKGVFGKMNVHQMIEHMTWAFQIANGTLKFEAENSPEITEKMHRFMMSDKQFRDNTPNSKLPEEPLAITTDSIVQAIGNLREEIDLMVNVYQEDNSLRLMNPFFGMLNFDEQVQLLHKHAIHHLRQFNALPA